MSELRGIMSALLTLRHAFQAEGLTPPCGIVFPDEMSRIDVGVQLYTRYGHQPAGGLTCMDDLMTFAGFDFVTR